MTRREERIAAQVKEDLERLGKTPDIRASLEDLMIRRPVKRCLHCQGKGYNTYPNPERDIGCRKCRGFGYVPMTLKDIRAAYADIRVYVYSRYGLSPKKFDAKARHHLKSFSNPSPGHWLYLARLIAKSFIHRQTIGTYL